MTAEIDTPKEILDVLYAPVGAVVIYWSLLEQSIEFWVAMIYHRPGGNKNWKKGPPFLLAAKLSFLRAKFADLAELQPFATEALGLLGEIEKMATVRDVLVHGAASTYNPSTQQIKFTRLGIDKAEKKHQERIDYLSIPDILDAGGKILNVNSRTLNFTQRLIDAIT
jgi:hypothetical protein